MDAICVAFEGGEETIKERDVWSALDDARDETDIATTAPAPARAEKIRRVTSSASRDGLL